jgi:hypothetical protein
MQDAVAAADDKIRYELLVARVLLRGRAGEKKVVGRVQQGRHEAVDFEAEPLESAQLFEDGAGNAKDVFFGFGHGGGG